jgi:hypothetical protein
MQALAVAGGGGALGAAVDYLRQAQKPEGGWGLNETGITNAQSTAWAVQGLVAAGISPASVRRSGHSPLDYLAARQASDGHYRYSSASDQTPIWVTAQALLAVKRKAFPLATVPRADRRAPGTGQGSPPTPPTGAQAVTDPAGGSDGGDSAVPQNRARGGRDGKKGREAPRAGPENEEAKAASAAESLASEPVALVDEPSSASSSDGDDGPGTAAYVGGGLALLACGLGGGFLWYRRRLP